MRNAIALACLMLGGCFQGNPAQSSSAQSSPVQQLANPASVNCGKLGGKLVIRKLADGSEVGICSFANGRQCEEWALYRNECGPG